MSRFDRAMTLLVIAFLVGVALRAATYGAWLDAAGLAGLASLLVAYWLNRQIDAAGHKRRNTPRRNP